MAITEEEEEEEEIIDRMDIWQKWFAHLKPHIESLKRIYFFSAYNTPIEERNMVNNSSILRPQPIQFNRCKIILLSMV